MFPTLGKKHTHYRASSLPKRTLGSIVFDMPVMIDSNLRQKPLFLQTQRYISSLEDKKPTVNFREKVPVCLKSRLQHFLEKLEYKKQVTRKEYHSVPKGYRKHSYYTGPKPKLKNSFFHTKPTQLLENNLIRASKLSLHAKMSKTNFQLKQLPDRNKIDDQSIRGTEIDRDSEQEPNNCKSLDRKNSQSSSSISRKTIFSKFMNT